MTGYQLHFGLRERPLTFAHGAARFASGPGLPDRALVLDLGQTGVYVYHNAPGRKVFIDARLEVPTLEIFERYRLLHTLLNRHDPRALLRLRRMRNPLVLMDHVSSIRAEATLSADSGWRCVYFDPIAAVFVPRSGADLEQAYPTVNFARRHFRGPNAKRLPPEASYAEARALVELSAALRRIGPRTLSNRFGAALLARDLALKALAARPEWAGPWTVLGHSAWNLDVETIADRRAGPDDPWDPATGMFWAQATYGYRRTLALSPGNRPALLALRDAFAARGMDGPRQQAYAALRHPARSLELRIANSAEPRALEWAAAERLAAQALHIGEPGAALNFWRLAAHPPSKALQLARIGDAYLAAMNIDQAIPTYQQAVDLDPRLGVAWYSLAFAEIEAGHLAAAIAACRAGRTLTLTDAQERNLQVFEDLLSSVESAPQ
jgi:tetratricopeptide (TPR) repeat protein